MLGNLGVDVEERRYFTDLPTENEVRELASILPNGVDDIISTRSRRYRELELADAQLTEEQWIRLLASEPGLWRRPIAVKDGETVVGYDEQALRALASDS